MTAQPTSNGITKDTKISLGALALLLAAALGIWQQVGSLNAKVLVADVRDRQMAGDIREIKIEIKSRGEALDAIYKRLADVEAHVRRNEEK